MTLPLIPEFAHGRCVYMIPGYGRCHGAWKSAQQACWQWDPIEGVGVEGPHVVLCRAHANVFARYKSQRVRIVGGWLGAANQYGYGCAVWDGETGWTPAPEWWAHRSVARFGAAGRRDAVG